MPLRMNGRTRMDEINEVAKIAKQYGYDDFDDANASYYDVYGES